MELTKEQTKSLFEIGRRIAHGWQEASGKDFKLDPDYEFTADGDIDLVADFCREEIGVDLDEQIEEEIWSDVWAKVRDGYASVVKEKYNLIGTDLIEANLAELTGAVL